MQQSEFPGFDVIDIFSTSNRDNMSFRCNIMLCSFYINIQRHTLYFNELRSLDDAQNNQPRSMKKKMIEYLLTCPCHKNQINLQNLNGISVTSSFIVRRPKYVDICIYLSI